MILICQLVNKDEIFLKNLNYGSNVRNAFDGKEILWGWL